MGVLPPDCSNLVRSPCRGTETRWTLLDSIPGTIGRRAELPGPLLDLLERKILERRKEKGGPGAILRRYVEPAFEAMSSRKGKSCNAPNVTSLSPSNTNLPCVSNAANHCPEK